MNEAAENFAGRIKWEAYWQRQIGFKTTFPHLLVCDTNSPEGPLSIRPR